MASVVDVPRHQLPPNLMGDIFGSTSNRNYRLYGTLPHPNRYLSSLDVHPLLCVNGISRGEFRSDLISIRRPHSIRRT
ncbi:hypothetical protein XFF6991_530181 [Xanthomonas phaseoli pv. phaseoli]|uniref:Uncharacterized protein n=1 Tax=Xanthomonas campestris pv. phaseoli TaxID=317013 RepID=A0A7Z7J585_XANCH|nr:hypothetical protein XFF6991_50004 [Xanthomonas phaseoli pv. phaseoli]SOO26332.1 hypothetical protein XFF6991_530181 [Xanthomonas phaseoli pv. phaseoli]